MKRLKTAAWFVWGLAWLQRGWGIREIEPGGLGDKQGGLETGLARLGFSGGGGLGGRGRLAQLLHNVPLARALPSPEDQARGIHARRVFFAVGAP